MDRRKTRTADRPLCLSPFHRRLWQRRRHKRNWDGLGPYFDLAGEDDTFSQPSWGKAETAMQKQALAFALEQAGITADQLDYVFAGDLLNQVHRHLLLSSGPKRPLLWAVWGLLHHGGRPLLAAMLIDGRFAAYAAAMTSSHFCSAEQQYRNPPGYGGQKPPTAQWTATGAGAVILSSTGKGPYVTHVTTGKVIDKGITDANNMGAAMAPAAYSTLRAHFEGDRAGAGFLRSHCHRRPGQPGERHRSRLLPAGWCVPGALLRRLWGAPL